MKPLRFASLVLAGALAVHQLRYLIGGHGAAPAGAGHGYLPLASVAAAMLVAAACAQLAAMVTRARHSGGADAERIGFARAWLTASLSIAAVFTAQELLEGLLAADRAGGLAAIVGAGGWVALPMATAMGALIALALVGAGAVVAAAARGARRPSRPSDRLPRRRRLSSGHRRVGDVLASNLAGRAPPLVV